MDPNLFFIDWERVFEALATIVVLAFILERGLAVIFESRYYINHVEKKEIYIKEFIALLVGIVVCEIWHFDAVSMVLLKAKTTWFGAAVTGAIVAGGSKASIKLFRDVFHFMSSAEDERQRIKKKELKKKGLLEDKWSQQELEKLVETLKKAGLSIKKLEGGEQE